MGFPAVHSDLAPAVRRGDLHLSTFCQLPNPDVIEALAKTKLDSFILDMQHGMYDEQAVLAGVAAATLEGKPAFVRLPVDSGGLASRVLDFGAAGVVCPMVNTVADAERLVSYSKFPPVGFRSWGPRRAIPLSGLNGPGYLAKANELNLAIAMIETRQALDNLDAILAVPGIDGVFVGPSDLSVSLSSGSTLDSPDVAPALDHVAERAKAAGKFAGIFAISPAYASDCVARGYSFIALMQDAMFMSQAADAAVASVRSKA